MKDKIIMTTTEGRTQEIVLKEVLELAYEIKAYFKENRIIGKANVSNLQPTLTPLVEKWNQRLSALMSEHDQLESENKTKSDKDYLAAKEAIERLKADLDTASNTLTPVSAIGKNVESKLNVTVTAPAKTTQPGKLKTEDMKKFSALYGTASNSPVKVTTKPVNTATDSPAVDSTIQLTDSTTSTASTVPTPPTSQPNTDAENPKVSGNEMDPKLTQSRLHEPNRQSASPTDGNDLPPKSLTDIKDLLPKTDNDGTNPDHLSPLPMGNENKRDASRQAALAKIMARIADLRVKEAYFASQIKKTNEQDVIVTDPQGEVTVIKGKFTQALDATRKLCTALDNNCEAFISNSKITPEQFKERCIGHVKFAHPVLDQHRGLLKNLLWNLLVSIATLVIVHTAFAIYKRTFFVLPTDTDTKGKLMGLEAEVNSLKPM